MNDWPTYRSVAQQVCTHAELDALALQAANLSQWQIALRLGISRRAVRDRLDNAHRKIANAMHHQEAAS